MGLPALMTPEVKAVKIGRHPVKVTALLYLKEALLAERYEQCSDFIMIACEFGADPCEVRNLLESPRRSV